ncbi:hypothetical protein [Alteromonas aquimaris]|uniref:hypothetical protein n=1 Tax=Alteromonas aquimaris TaxID=2998417 RepID=UPI0022437937|nr:hypothetical protein [Alteromonas aquimaris]
MKRAWDNSLEASFKKKFSVTFFAARGTAIGDIKIDEGALVPITPSLQKVLEFTSGGKKSIVLKDYDMFFLYGLGINAYYIKDTFYSGAVVRQTVADIFEPRLANRILSMIRKGSSKRVFIGHNPMPVHAKSDTIPLSEESYNFYANGTSLSNEHYFSKLNCELVMQPKQTLVGNARSTHSRFSKGSMKLDVSAKRSGQLHNDLDRKHMNEEFGLIFLKELFEKFEESYESEKMAKSGALRRLLNKISRQKVR